LDSRPPAPWHADYRAAFCITVDVDGPYGELNYRSPDDTYWISQTAYDPTGTDELIGIFADTGVPVTFFWVGRAAQDRPDRVISTLDAGHEIALHSWDHRWYNTLTPEEQRDDLERSLEVLLGITGTKPRGHKTASWRYDETTHRLVQELGLEWIMDIPDGDKPSLLRPAPELPPLVNLPPSWLQDDYNFYVDRLATPRATAEFWTDDLDTLRDRGGLMTLTLHPFVSGRPGPSRAIARLIDYAIELGDIWIATCSDVADWWRASHPSDEGTITGDR
jgi:peptidoglycan-N-acetylglucosamine deacetylase